MDELYKQIAGILLNNAPEVKWVDIDEGQLDDYPIQDMPLTFPCALIKTDADVDYETLAGGKQIARTNISIKLAFKVFESGHAKVPNDKYFDHYQIVKKVSGLIHQLVKNCSRMNVKKYKQVDPLIYELTFKIAYLDNNV